jgi:hypothetical protein
MKNRFSIGSYKDCYDLTGISHEKRAKIGIVVYKMMMEGKLTYALSGSELGVTYTKGENEPHSRKELEDVVFSKADLTKWIQNSQHLIDLASREDGVECFILTNAGRSSKRIFYIDELFSITNEIDDSEQLLNIDELYTLSNIGEALDKGALYEY